MEGRQDTPRDNFRPALEAIGNLLQRELNEILFDTQMAAQNAHTEIEFAPINSKGGAFWRHYLPCRKSVVTLLVSSYRRYIKLALAHPHQAGPDLAQWACDQLQPAVGAALEWIRDWYILACDGENRYIQRIASTEFVPGTTVTVPLSIPVPPAPESWRAPAWLFQVSLALVGVGCLKSEHVPPADSEQKLGAAHTRLLLKGAKRVFVWELQAALERVRDEEIADAGAIPSEPVNSHTRGPNKRRGWEQRQKLYSAIQKVLSDNRGLEGIKFCAELDKRHAPPLFDWMKSGEWREGLTWKEAWDVPGLRRKIRRVRQEAMKGR